MEIQEITRNREKFVHEIERVSLCTSNCNYYLLYYSKLELNYKRLD